MKNQKKHMKDHFFSHGGVDVFYTWDEADDMINKYWYTTRENSTIFDTEAFDVRDFKKLAVANNLDVDNNADHQAIIVLAIISGFMVGK